MYSLHNERACKRARRRAALELVAAHGHGLVGAEVVLVGAGGHGGREPPVLFFGAEEILDNLERLLVYVEILVRL